jgi:hypothetical protein
MSRRSAGRGLLDRELAWTPLRLARVKDGRLTVRLRLRDNET